jgi:hypothetical protein
LSSECELGIQIEGDEKRKGMVDMMKEELRRRREEPIFGFDVFEGKMNMKGRMRKKEILMGSGGDGEPERGEKWKKGEEVRMEGDGEKEKKKKGNSLLSYLLVSLFFI